MGPTNNGFGSFGNSAIPSGGGGDIILSPTKASGQGKKSWKWVAVVLVVLILMVGLVVAIFFLNNNKSTDDVSTETKLLFNRYANYLLFQSDDDADIPDGSWTDDKLNEKIMSDDAGRSEYVSGLVSLYDNFLGSFENGLDGSTLDDNEEDTDVDAIYGLVENNSNALGTLQKYLGVSNITAQGMIDMYLSRGGDSMVNLVEDTYKGFAESDDLYDYGELKIELAKMITNLYNEYTNMGCIVSQQLVQECVESTISAGVLDAKNLIDEYIDEIDGIEWHIANDIVSLSRMIYEELNSEGIIDE